MNLTKLMEMAGFFTAHAIWTVSLQQGVLPPMLVTETQGERNLTRFDNEASMEDAVAKARDLLNANPTKAERGIIVYDAFVTLGERQYDAIIVHCLEDASAQDTIEIIQPYRPTAAAGGFAVMQPKVSLPEEHVDLAEELIEAFFRGLDSHEEGGPLWSESMMAIPA